MPWCVYIIKSLKTRWYYVGSTNNSEKRLKEHNAGHVTSTKNYVPLKLVFKKVFDSEKEARTYEKKIKKKRIEKEKIIREVDGKK